MHEMLNTITGKNKKKMPEMSNTCFLSRKFACNVKYYFSGKCRKFFISLLSAEFG